MLNEPLGGEAEAAEAQGAPHTNYIQVTQQEKEAIERVRLLPSDLFENITHWIENCSQHSIVRSILRILFKADPLEILQAVGKVCEMGSSC